MWRYAGRPRLRAGRTGAVVSAFGGTPADDATGTARSPPSRRSDARARRCPDPGRGPRSGRRQAAAGGRGEASRRGAATPSSAPTTAVRCSSRRCGSGRSPAYLFTGGLAAGTARARRRRRPDRTARRCAGSAGSVRSAALLASVYFLVADLGPARPFHHMLRVAQTDVADERGHVDPDRVRPGRRASRRSTELLPAAVRRTLARPAAARGSPGPPGCRRRSSRPAVASYTAVLLSHTAVPAWNEAHARAAVRLHRLGGRERRRLRDGCCVPVEEAGPARAFAAVGAAKELVAAQVLEQRLGLTARRTRPARPHRLRRWSERLTAARPARHAARAPQPRAPVAAGTALLAGSALQRFGVFEAGVESTKDPKYVVVPQRRRLDKRGPAGSRP